MAIIAIMVGGAVLTSRLSLAAIISQGRLAGVTKLHLKEKSAMIKVSWRIKWLTPNTCATAPDVSTGLRPTSK